eukprot:TRINITY_DN32406_c0_g1_i1.p1 TRINITY_DN32406_c0_g1~~TRINITY_DN32406_c0_g1_i1.p1  ORF type:complete len:541 (+),score=140.18 TRINITY_DN32406_c0_g1_i1:103-1623(+)
MATTLGNILAAEQGAESAMRIASEAAQRAESAEAAANSAEAALALLKDGVTTAEHEHAIAIAARTTATAREHCAAAARSVATVQASVAMAKRFKEAMKKGGPTFVGAAADFLKAAEGSSSVIAGPLNRPPSRQPESDDEEEQEPTAPSGPLWLKFDAGAEVPLVLRPGATVSALREEIYRAGGPRPHEQVLTVGGKRLPEAGLTAVHECSLLQTGNTVRVERCPRAVHPAAKPAVVCCGDQHAAVALASGGMREWGLCVEMSPPGEVTSCSVGRGVTAAVIKGTLYVWGLNAETLRQDLADMEDANVCACSMPAAGTSLLALTHEGGVAVCGDVKQWCHPPPPDLKGRACAVACGTTFAVVLTKGGTVCRWGKGLPQMEYAFGELTAVGVSAGADHYSVVLHDGTVHCSGSNRKGQCDVPAGLIDATHCVCGDGFTVALRKNGRLLWWGDVPSRRHKRSVRISAIAAGPRYVAMVTRDGEIIVDGDPGVGLGEPPRVPIVGYGCAK